MKKILLENPNEIETESQTEDVVEEVVENFEIDDNCIIASGTIINLSTYIVEENNIVASLQWLCMTKAQNMFILCAKYLVEDEDELKSLENIAFHDSKLFIGSKIVSDTLLNELPVFLTNMEFSLIDNDSDNSKIFYLDSVNLTKEGLGNKVRFYTDSELFASLKFSDAYIINKMFNNYDDINLAILSAASHNSSDLFIVDNIDSVVSMAKIDKKSNAIAVIFKVSREIDSQKESVFLLVPFYLDMKLPKSKFKSNTIEKINSSYMIDGDQYISNFIVPARFENLDKMYLCIKSINKNQESKLFLLDNAAKDELEKLIMEY